MNDDMNDFLHYQQNQEDSSNDGTDYINITNAMK